VAAAQAALQFSHYLRDAIAPAKRSVFCSETSDLVQNLDIDLNALANTGTLDFHRHLISI